MTRDTDIGGASARFPSTHGSAVAGARSADPGERTRSFDALVAAYWKPVYKTIRLRFRKSNEDAKDLTQAFFLRALEKDFFAPYDPAKGRFRTFLRTCLEAFLANEHRAAARLKRGGGATMLPLDFDGVEAELAAACATGASPADAIDRTFDAEWVRCLIGLAVEALRAECAARGREVHFRLFERYDLDDARPRSEPGRLTYEDLAAEVGLPVTTVTNQLALARREFRRLLLEKLREITASDDEFRQEARLLLGADPK